MASLQAQHCNESEGSQKTSPSEVGDLLGRSALDNERFLQGFDYSPPLAISTARNTAPALFTVS
jgi:hypothetical protein